MTDETMRAAFDAWCSTDSQRRRDQDNFLGCRDWRVWKAATLRERERCAQLCFDNQEEISRLKGRSLAPFIHETEALHAGMTYAAAIRKGES